MGNLATTNSVVRCWALALKCALKRNDEPSCSLLGFSPKMRAEAQRRTQLLVVGL
ncbi:hypothetical protein [Spirulina subsalsa]|uniref:hypothetical protein n=1 Tax=Spirulina subsalsa TaxID=54311 RepID=UPI0002F94D3D|nr:hypothetical protein [Spirulina subsalsa]